MSKIRIKHFGPIKEGLTTDDGWIDVRKVTVFIGNQGSGKSVVAKLISTFSWMEKVLTRGDYDKTEFEVAGVLKEQYLSYHRIQHYFDKDGRTLIEYQGESYHFRYANGGLTIDEAKNGEYHLPQIVYMPAERNFVSYVEAPATFKLVSGALSEFVTEVYHAARAMRGAVRLPIDLEVSVEYQETSNKFYLRGQELDLDLTESASGFQSLVPLYLVSAYRSDTVMTDARDSQSTLTGDQRERLRQRFREIDESIGLTSEMRRIAYSELAKSFIKTAFVNIVEEPEQNLYPSSQWGILKKLLEFNNFNIGNRLILTTHSPYLVNFLSIAIEGAHLNQLIRQNEMSEDKREDMIVRLKGIIPIASTVGSDEVIIYEMDEMQGTIAQLPSRYGIPSDRNFLNISLRNGNELFDQLLELEQEL